MSRASPPPQSRSTAWGSPVAGGHGGGRGGPAEAPGLSCPASHVSSCGQELRDTCPAHQGALRFVSEGDALTGLVAVPPDRGMKQLFQLLWDCLVLGCFWCQNVLQISFHRGARPPDPPSFLVLTFALFFCKHTDSSRFISVGS